MNVLITGASGDIGGAIAKSFALDGNNVALQYFSNDFAINELAKECANYCMVRTYKCDLSDFSQIADTTTKIVNDFGNIDILINNAGIADINLLTDLADEKIKKIIDVNLTSAILVTKYCIPQMVSNGFGRIINVSSMWGICGASCEVAYSASKAGMIGFTKALSKELAPSGITVNAVAPGLIDTKMNSHLSDDDLKALIEETPVGRIGKTDDVVNAVRFFAKAESSFITGETLSVTGGF